MFKNSFYNRIVTGDNLINAESLDEKLNQAYQHFAKRLVDETAEAEISHYVQAAWNERNLTRTDQRNGYQNKPRTINFQKITIKTNLPRLRHTSYEFSFIQKFQQNTQKFEEHIIKMLMFGQSALEISELFHDIPISAATVKTICKKLDNELLQWKNIPIADNYPILFLDGLWFKTQTHKAVILFVLGIDSTGKKSIIDFETSLNGESSSTWNRLLHRLYFRGLQNSPRVIVRDRKPGLADVIDLVYPCARQQSCIVHIIRNVVTNLSNRRYLYQIYHKVADIFKVESQIQFNRKLNHFIKLWQHTEPKLCTYLQNLELDHILTFLRFPKEIRKLIYTNNHIERCFGCIRANTKKIRTFFDVFSLERFIYLNIIRYNYNKYEVKDEYKKNLKNLHANY